MNRFLDEDRCFSGSARSIIGGDARDADRPRWFGLRTYNKVAANYVLKVNGNITIDASGLVTTNGAKIIFNG